MLGEHGALNFWITQQHKRPQEQVFKHSTDDTRLALACIRRQELRTSSKSRPNQYGLIRNQYPGTKANMSPIRCDGSICSRSSITGSGANQPASDRRGYLVPPLPFCPQNAPPSNCQSQRSTCAPHYIQCWTVFILLFTFYGAAEHVTTGKDFPRLQICPGSSTQRLLMENTDNSSLTC